MPLSMRIVFAVFGAGAIAFSLWLRRAGIHSQSWPSTAVRIVRSKLVSDPHDSGSSVEISYEFSVGGREFKSSCISFSPLPNDPDSKAELVARYPVGADAEAYYDPENPQRSVLLRDESRNWVWGPVVGTAFVSIATFAP